MNLLINNKNKFCVFFLTMFSFSCKKEQAVIDQLSLLPLETTNGANTFGCLVDGVAYLPWGGNYYCAASLTFGKVEPIVSKISIYNELEIWATNTSGDCTIFGPSNFDQVHRYGKIDSLETGKTIEWKRYPWLGATVFPFYDYYIWFDLYDDSLMTGARYRSYDNSGSTFISKHDRLNKVLSGTFSGKVKIEGTTREKTITNGRFDIKYQ